MTIKMFNNKKPLLKQLKQMDLEFDQKLFRALQLSASNPDISPEDTGFPDSYLLLAIYRTNSILTRICKLDESRYNLFHEYKIAPKCKPEEVIPGNKLCGILNYIIHEQKVNKTIGVGHFLKAVIQLSLNNEPEDMSWLGFKNQVIHNTFSIETLLWGLGYNAWTPLKDAPKVTQILTQLEGREDIEDFQYMLTIENNKFIFRPISIIDTFKIKDELGTTNKTAILPHFIDNFTAFTEDEILELEELINNMKVKEHDLQKFFEKHPRFLRIWDHREIFPNIYLTREKDGPLIPDFILINYDLQKAMILDLKLPKSKLITLKKNRERFASSIHEARAQLITYRNYFDIPLNRKKYKEKFGMEIYKPHLGVIIGRSEEFKNEYNRQKLESNERDLEIFTYDDIINFAKRRRMIIQGG